MDKEEACATVEKSAIASTAENQYNPTVITN